MSFNPEARLPINSLLVNNPEHLGTYRRTLNAYETISPTTYTSEEGINLLGNTLIQHARNLVDIEPYKSDWRNYAPNFKNIRAEFKGEELPYPGMLALANEYERKWNTESALKNPTILPVVQQILASKALWNDEAIRALVITHVYKRGIAELYDFEEMMSYFQGKIPQGDMNNEEEAKALVNQLADNSQEMSVKRIIDMAKMYSTSSVLPEKFVRMSNDDWDMFMSTPEGQQLGIYSTVQWITARESRNPNVQVSPWLQKYSIIADTALETFTKDSNYQQFVKESDVIINEALKEFRAK